MPQDMTRTDAVPSIDWFDPSEMVRDPYPAYARLREAGPVVWVPRIQRYLLTTHASVAAAEHAPEIFTAHASRPTMVRALGGRPMLRKDDPEHAQERSAINPTLRPRQIKATWSPKFDRTVTAGLAHLREIGPAHADLNRDFAGPVASRNLIDLLGFPAEVTTDDMHRWSTDFIAGIGNILDDPDIWARCDTSQAEVASVLDDLIPWLRAHPDPSVTSHLLQAGLPEEVVRANVHLTISGGMNEPQHVITNMVWALSGHPEQRAAAAAGQVAWGDVFEETVRWLSPIGMLPRETTQSVDWFGAQLPEGANVGLLIGSANRDSDVFENPDVFDIARSARGHLGFGAGVHLCAGRWAAKNAVGEIAIPRLLAELPDLRVDPDRTTTWDGWVFRGITTLPVTW